MCHDVIAGGGTMVRWGALSPSQIHARNPAWRTLKPVPRTAFIELVGIYNGVNNGWLAMSPAPSPLPSTYPARLLPESSAELRPSRVHRADQAKCLLVQDPIGVGMANDHAPLRPDARDAIESLHAMATRKAEHGLTREPHTVARERHLQKIRQRHRREPTDDELCDCRGRRLRPTATCSGAARLLARRIEALVAPR